MAVSIGAALSAPQLVLYSLIAVGMAANKLGGAGGPLAVYFITIVASECGKIVSKETKVDILVTPAVTILVGVGLSVLCAPTVGAAASSVGDFIKWATNLQPAADGHSGVRRRRHGADAADFQRGDLRGALADGACGRRGGCGLLRADGRLRGHVLPRERRGRLGQSGAGHVDAANAQHHPAIRACGFPRRLLPPSPARFRRACSTSK